MSLSVDQFQQIVANENAFIIDTRDEALFLEGYVPNSIHFKPEIIHQAAALGLLSFEQPLVFVGDNDNEKIAIAYFEKLGFFKDIKNAVSDIQIYENILKSFIYII